WTHRDASLNTDVDHIVETQVTPSNQLETYDAFQNFELLDASANRRSGPRLRHNIAIERARQAAFDPALATATLTFEAVTLDGGSPPIDAWAPDEIARGDHLDV